MNEPIEWLRYLPIFILLAYVVPITWLLLSNPLGKGHSISEHIAASRKSFLLIGLSLTTITLALVAYFLFWLGPTYNLPPILILFALACLLGGLGTAWLPANSPGSNKPKNYWHVSSAAIWLLSCISICVIFLVTVPLETAPITYLTAQCTAIILMWLTLLYALYKPARNHFVLYETIGIVTFFILIIIMSLRI